MDCERVGAGEVEFKVRTDGVSILGDDATVLAGRGELKGNEELGASLYTAWPVWMSGSDVGSGGTGTVGITGLAFIASLDLRIKLRYGEDPFRLGPIFGSCELLHSLVDVSVLTLPSTRIVSRGKMGASGISLCTIDGRGGGGIDSATEDLLSSSTSVSYLDSTSLDSVVRVAVI